MRRLRRRVARFFDALPPYPGGKRRLIGSIAALLPPPASAPTLVDPFLGGGSVSIWAKARGYRVLANDIALRSATIGRALIANDRTRLSRQDVVRLFASTSEEPEVTALLHLTREVLPSRHAQFVAKALPHALRLGGTKGALLLLLLIRYILALRPMGNFGAKAIIEQMDAGDWEAVNPSALRGGLVHRVQSHPRGICEELRGKINHGIFANGRENETHQRDVFDFLAAAEADVVYLDPPYGGTSAYESALKPLDAILEGRRVDGTPSIFSGRGAREAMEQLFAACRRIPVWVVSYGGAAIGPDELQRMVEKHRQHVIVELVYHAHLPNLASLNSRRENQEILIRAEGMR